jgi:hypothetical protein
MPRALPMSPHVRMQRLRRSRKVLPQRALLHRL